MITRCLLSLLSPPVSLIEDNIGTCIMRFNLSDKADSQGKERGGEGRER